MRSSAWAAAATASCRRSTAGRIGRRRNRPRRAEPGRAHTPHREARCDGTAPAPARGRVAAPRGRSRTARACCVHQVARNRDSSRPALRISASARSSAAPAALRSGTARAVSACRARPRSAPADSGRACWRWRERGGAPASLSLAFVQLAVEGADDAEHLDLQVGLADEFGFDAGRSGVEQLACRDLAARLVGRDARVAGAKDLEQEVLHRSSAIGLVAGDARLPDDAAHANGDREQRHALAPAQLRWRSSAARPAT